MAIISKQGGRKLVEEETTPFAGTGVRWSASDGSGFVTGRGDYRLTVGKHIVQVGEDEMLDIVTDWMIEYRRQRNTKKRREADAKARSA